MLIGFCGPMRAGKTTAATHLVMRGWIRMSFAQSLRRECARMLASVGISSYHVLEEEMRTPSMKETYRGLMQWHGVFRRTHDPDHWVRLLRQRLEMSLERGFSVAVDDVRFFNEAVMLRELGGKIVCIDSDHAELSEHESEQDWKSMAVDAHLWNNGTQEGLAHQINDLLDEWRT